MNQEKSITIKTNTTFQFESFSNYENEYIGLHDYNRIIIKERIINVHIKKDDYNKIKL